MIDKKKETFLLLALPESLERATLKFRGEAVTRFRIFDRILTPATGTPIECGHLRLMFILPHFFLCFVAPFVHELFNTIVEGHQH